MRIFVLLALIGVLLTACDSDSKNAAKQQPSSATVSTPIPVSSPPPTESKPKVSENKAMLALNGFEQFTWGMSKSAASSLAKSYGQTSNEPPEIMVKVQGHSEWFGLHFSGGKLDSVMKRYNLKNGGSEKQIKKIEAKYGPPTTVEDAGNEKSYTWIGKHTKIVASYQPATEYYVNIEYTPLSPIDSGISDSLKQEIWGYYTKAEDKYGMDKAEEMTAKKFKISKDDVVNIKVEGGKGGWALPGEEKDVPKYHSEEERQKANQEFGAELYRQGEIIRKSGY